MKYPNNIKKDKKVICSYSNRGMFLESIINETNNYYLDKNIAVIYKKPTPIGIVKTVSSKITEAYFKEASTLDYNGIYNGKYIEFDAKETKNKTAFPINNIHTHQLKHMSKIKEHGGIAFIILSMNDNYYILTIDFLQKFISENERKSIPIKLIDEKCYKLNYNYYKGIDYLEKINKIMEDKNEVKEN